MLLLEQPRTLPTEPPVDQHDSKPAASKIREALGASGLAGNLTSEAEMKTELWGLVGMERSTKTSETFSLPFLPFKQGMSQIGVNYAH